MLVKKFEEQVKKTPHHVAVKTGNRPISYRELNRYANRIARLLTAAGPTHKEAGNVGLLLEHGPAMISAILGTLKAGKVYVPMTADYPHNRLAYMLEDSGTSLLIANHATMAIAKSLTGKSNILLLDLDGCQDEASDPNEDENPEREINRESLAYILYTSGSTGKPKGVMQTHQNILYFIQHWTQRFSITGTDRITLLASFCHDGSIPDIYSALLNGASLYPYDVRKQDHHLNLSSFLIQEKITVWHSVPSLYNFFVNTLTGKEHFPDLRHIILGGEALRGYEIEMFKKYFPGADLASIYGQTESTVNSLWTVRASDHINHNLLGTPLDNIRLFVVDGNDDEVDTFETGEILVASPHISPGYWKNRELTKKVFSRDPAYGPLYWTGDMGRLLPDGNIEFMGRKDSQVKIRGFRVELGEIETTLMRMQGIKEAVLVAKEKENGNTYLCAFFSAAKEYNVTELRNFLSGELPGYMIPAHLVQLEKMPLTPTGKIDRKALAMTEVEPLKSTAVYAAPQTELEKIIANTWKQVLGLEEVGIHDNLFEIGGNSFDIININRKLSEIFRRNIPIVKILEYPTIEDLARYLHQHQTDKKTAADNRPTGKYAKTRGISLEIAVIGMAGRFPGARNIDEFWENLKNSVESIVFFSEETLMETGLPSETVKNPNYVKSKGVLEDIEYFDAAFFNFTPAEADVMDPQLRIFYECCWETFEHGGYNPTDYEGAIGVYAGNAFNIVWLAMVFSQMGGPVGQFEKGFLNNHLSTYISYKLDLTGPSVTIRTACSTSLVAVHEACQGLLLNECDMALAGGVSILVPQKTGYLYQEGMIYSSDGHVRAFDAQSRGTVFGDGLGCVLLKRLEDALSEGDTIYAVIKGSAVNNDGIRKVGYTAPGTAGQREVVRSAQMAAGFEPETIGFIETHGTGTILGDAVEIEALNQVFPGSKEKYCALASVKTNVGHLNSAAGITGFIKTVLALKYKLIPPSLHFETPNPEIDFDKSAFYINTKLSGWKNANPPLRAGVSSFGFGGTNAHLVLEEAPIINTKASSAPQRPYQLILLSAKTQSALDKTTENLVDYFKNSPNTNLADAAYTLGVGRKTFQYKRKLVCSDIDEAISELSSQDSIKVRTFNSKKENPLIVFVFAGLGSQYLNMGLDLYKNEPLFRDELNHCFEILKSLMNNDVKAILYPDDSTALRTRTSPANLRPDINQPEFSQPIIFIFEYTLAVLLMKWGINPHALIGYSLGEYVAACTAGVFSLKDALKLVVSRGQLIQKILPGVMLSVPLPVEDVTPLLSSELSLAIDNGPSCIVAGPTDAITAFEKQLKERKVLSVQVPASHAIHSKMMEPISREFERLIAQITLNKPKIPFISNVTGTWIEDEEVVTPAYWVKHLNQTVQFSLGMKELAKEDKATFLEIGAGQDLSALILRYIDKDADQRVFHFIRPPHKNISDVNFMMNKIGRLWLHGVKIDWSKFYSNRQGHRIPLPTYAFDRQRYNIHDNALLTGKYVIPYKARGKKKNISEWFYIPSWKRFTFSVNQETGIPGKSNWLVFMDDRVIGNELVKRLEKYNQDVTQVEPGPSYAKKRESLFIINPKENNDYIQLIAELEKVGKIPGKIIHLWSLIDINPGRYDAESFDKSLDLNFYSLIYLVRAIEKDIIGNIKIEVVTTNIHDVTGNERLCPEKAVILGPCKTIPQEYPNIRCRCIDIELPGSKKPVVTDVVNRLFAEITAKFPDTVAAHRGNHRWIQTFESLPLEESLEKQGDLKLKQGGVYLITGGLGKVGLILAGYLAKKWHAKLLLTGVSEFPPGDKWEQWLAEKSENDTVSRKIREVMKLEKWGGEVLACSVDAANEKQMRRVIQQAEKKFGQLDGVIHAAGVTGNSLTSSIGNLDRARCNIQFQPKIFGLLALEKLLAKKKLDFCMLTSSISSILGGLGFLAYSTANIFMDAYTHYHNRTSSTRWICVNWDGWKNLEGPTGEGDPGGTLSNLSMEPGEGIKAFLRILSCSDIHQVINSTGDLQLRINRWIKLEPVEEMDNSAQKPHETTQQRPDLTTPYVAPRNHIEKSITHIWQRLSGFDQIGIDDDFFEMGGDSLKAVALTSGIKKIGYHVALTDILSNPTVKKLAAVIDEKNISEEVREEIDEKALLSQLACIEKLNKGRNEKNIFIIHPLHGMVNQYKELALLLEKKYNVYGIQARGVKPGSEMSESPRQMIDDYLEQILAVQKNGPFIIAGYCIGATISYEIVRKLESLDQPVEKLILFDSHALFRDRNVRIIRALEYLPGFVKRVVLFSNERKFKKAIQAKTFGKIDESDGEEIKWGNNLHKEQVKKYMNILGNHVIPLEIIKAPILMAQAENGPYTHFTEAHFNKVTKSRSTVIRTPGDHDSIWQKPDVEKLAEVIINNV